ncbi:MAG: hypothetical protein J6P53_04770, partial [Mailhella sp.]|nr:hypothetical protein [Mailhella sp.]
HTSLQRSAAGWGHPGGIPGNQDGALSRDLVLPQDIKLFFPLAAVVVDRAGCSDLRAKLDSAGIAGAHLCGAGRGAQGGAMLYPCLALPFQQIFLRSQAAAGDARMLAMRPHGLLRDAWVENMGMAVYEHGRHVPGRIDLESAAFLISQKAVHGKENTVPVGMFFALNIHLWHETSSVMIAKS